MRFRMDWRTVTFDWNRARALLVTAEEGSFSAAARALGLTQPTVGRQVAALEEELGVTLFERVGRGLRLTATGVDLVEHARAMGAAATRLSLTAAGRSEALEGAVCITASEIVTARLLPPVVAAIRATHPRIEVELVATNAARDLRRREADIAVRNFRPTDPTLVARKVRDSVAYPYAAPAYLDRVGRPRDRADLARLDWLAFDRTDQMTAGLRQLGVPVEAGAFPIVTANHLVQWALCRAGMGVCLMMADVGDAEPGVERVLPSDPPGIPIPIWVVSHRELRTSRRVRVVFDLLVEGLRDVPAGPSARAPA